MGVFGELGVYRGSGEWGVTTLKLNPLTNDYYVTLFQGQADAITYARGRAFQSGLASKGGAVQYVVEAPEGQHDRFGRRALYPLFRVLRAYEPVLDRTGHRPPGPPRKDEQWVMVLKNAGITTIGRENPDLIVQGKGIRWQKDKTLSIRVTEYEDALVQAAARRGDEQISRHDRIPRGVRQKVRQVRSVKTGAKSRVPTSPVRLMDLMRGARSRQEHEEDARARDAVDMDEEATRAEAASLRQQAAELKRRVEQIQANIMRKGGPRKAPEKLLSELESTQERLADTRDQLNALVGE